MVVLLGGDKLDYGPNAKTERTSKKDRDPEAKTSPIQGLLGRRGYLVYPLGMVDKGRVVCWICHRAEWGRKGTG